MTRLHKIVPLSSHKFSTLLTAPLDLLGFCLHLIVLLVLSSRLHLIVLLVLSSRLHLMVLLVLSSRLHLIVLLVLSSRLHLMVLFHQWSSGEQTSVPPFCGVLSQLPTLLSLSPLCNLCSLVLQTDCSKYTNCSVEPQFVAISGP